MVFYRSPPSCCGHTAVTDLTIASHLLSSGEIRQEELCMTVKMKTSDKFAGVEQLATFSVTLSAAVCFGAYYDYIKYIK